MTDSKTSWDNLMAELRQIIERGSKNDDYFLSIPGLFERIPELVLYDDSSKQGVCLVHYTTWKNASDMFNVSRESPVLRMYNYEQSNDPEEGRIKPPEWKKVEEDAACLNKFLGHDSHWREESTYGCSFSSGLSDVVEDDLTYWRLYGNDGQGCSLKIPTTDIVDAYKVRYRDRDFNRRSGNDEREDQQVAKRLRKLLEVGKEAVDRAPEKHRNIVGRTVAVGLHQVIYGYYHLIKHKAYKDENEWRILRVMPRLDTIRYDTRSEYLVRRYIDGPVLKDLLISDSTITIGPAVHNLGAARAYFEYLTRKHEMKPVKVRISNKTYRQVPSLNPERV